LQTLNELVAPIERFFSDGDFFFSVNLWNIPSWEYSSSSANRKFPHFMEHISLLCLQEQLVSCHELDEFILQPLPQFYTWRLYWKFHRTTRVFYWKCTCNDGYLRVMS
jgi:hypothetical protein